jgi:hypothetical protein
MNPEEARDAWAVLKCEPTTDLRTLKKAYAKELKVRNPEEHPKAFQELRQAYEFLKELIQSGVIEAEQATGGQALPKPVKTIQPANQPLLHQAFSLPKPVKTTQPANQPLLHQAASLPSPEDNPIYMAFLKHRQQETPVEELNNWLWDTLTNDIHQHPKHNSMHRVHFTGYVIEHDDIEPETLTLLDRIFQWSKELQLAHPYSDMDTSLALQDRLVKARYGKMDRHLERINEVIQTGFMPGIFNTLKELQKDSAFDDLECRGYFDIHMAEILHNHLTTLGMNAADIMRTLKWDGDTFQWLAKRQDHSLLEPLYRIFHGLYVETSDPNQPVKVDEDLKNWDSNYEGNKSGVLVFLFGVSLLVSLIYSVFNAANPINSKSNYYDPKPRTYLEELTSPVSNSELEQILAKNVGNLEAEDLDGLRSLFDFRLPDNQMRKAILERSLVRFDDALSQGANPRNCAVTNYNALHLAVEVGWLQMVERILEFGLSPYEACKAGISPYELAKEDPDKQGLVDYFDTYWPKASEEVEAHVD